MKLLLTLALACTLAHAQTSTSEWWLDNDPSAIYSTQSTCDAAARKANKAWSPECPRHLRILPKQPPAESQFVKCPAGTAGPGFTQTRTYSVANGDWIAGPWTPASSPLCVAPPASNMPVVDRSKIPAARIGMPGPMIRTSLQNQVPNLADVGAFRLGCYRSHFLFDDPLVFPGQPGVSHLHIFWGNTGLTANSTVAGNASSGNSTCSGGTLNRSAYWTPAVIDTTDGSPVDSSGFLVYYKTGYGGVKPADVKAVPTGLRFISGAAAGNPATPSTAGRFACIGGPDGTPGVGWQTTIPATGCAPGQSMLMEVSFPQCWDGVNLDSPDHKSHMHDATGSGCPSTHPVALPSISYEVYYSITAANVGRMPKWRLSSDNYDPTKPAGYSAHGDYLMGWDPATMTKIIKNCDNPSMDCHANLLGDGTELWMPDAQP